MQNGGIGNAQSIEDSFFKRLHVAMFIPKAANEESANEVGPFLGVAT